MAAMRDSGMKRPPYSPKNGPVLSRSDMGLGFRSWRPSDGEEILKGAHGVALGDECLADQHDVGPCGAVVGDIRCRLHRGLGDPDDAGWNLHREFTEELLIELEGRQVACVDADQSSANVERTAQFLGTVGLDER